MAKVYKDIYINWTWGGDEKLLKGFNVALTTSGGNPNRDSIIIQKTNNKKTDILNKGTEQYEHIFRNVMMNDTEEHVAWVQALTDGDDSEWISTTNMVINDDGTATIETTDGAKNKANNAETNAKSYTDDEITNLDDALTNDINALGTEIDNMSSDSKITRAEANVLEQRLNELKKEDDNLISVATTLGISSTAYTNSINTLDTYLSSYIGQTNYPIDIADRATMKSSFEAVQNEKTALINAITDKRADNAKAEAMSYTDSEITTLNNNLSDDIDNLGSTISDMSADNKITRAEANVLEQRLNEVKAEDNNFISVASGLGLSTTNYSNAINALETYLSSYINQTSYPINITDRATMKTKFDDVQTAKTALINSITETMAINAEANAKDYTDTLETSLGNLAFDNLVEKAKLGSTIIDGGYIKSYLLTADNILTGTLGANRVQIGGGTTYESGYDPSTKETPSGAQSKANTAKSQAISSANGYTDTQINSLGNLAHKDLVEQAMKDETIITNGYIDSSYITADNIRTGTIGADQISVNDLSAINATFSGTLNGATGTFSNSLEAEGGQVLLTETPYGGRITTFSDSGQEYVTLSSNRKENIFGDATEGGFIGIKNRNEYSNQYGIVMGINEDFFSNEHPAILLYHSDGSLASTISSSHIYFSQGSFVLSSIPTSDPQLEGRVWRSGNTLKISTG